jgi:hypothetical protein
MSRTGMLGVLRKHRFGMLFSIIADLVVSVTVAPARAADLRSMENPRRAEGQAAHAASSGDYANEMRRSAITARARERPAVDVEIGLVLGLSRP